MLPVPRAFPDLNFNININLNPAAPRDTQPSKETNTPSSSKAVVRVRLGPVFSPQALAINPFVYYGMGNGRTGASQAPTDSHHAPFTGWLARSIRGAAFRCPLDTTTPQPDHGVVLICVKRGRFPVRFSSLS
jgi:hypothetical protein